MKMASEIDPEAPVFHNKLGALYLMKGLLDAAESEIKLALSIERSIPLLNAHFNMALLHEARGEISQAIQEYEKEKEISPFNHRPYFNLGLIFAKAKETDKAIAEFGECIAKNESYADAYVFLAKAYMESQRNLDEAIRLAIKGIDLNPSKRTAILAHFVRADLYNRQGKDKKSQQHVARAKELQKLLSN